MASPLRHPDLVVVGAGIVGLAHAVEAVSRGLSVHIIERDAYAVGASIRNFGHIGVSVQTGMAFDVALSGRTRWLRMAQQCDFWAAETGSVVVARAEDELSVLKEFAAARDGIAELLDAGQVRDRVPVHGEGVIGGAWLPQDVRVDPLAAVAAISAWLGEQPGVEISWGTSLVGLASDGVLTSRGEIHAERVVVCVGHDVDQIFPSIADQAGLRRCRLHMLEVDSPMAATFFPAVLSGLSPSPVSGLHRLPECRGGPYPGAARAAGAARVRDQSDVHPAPERFAGDRRHPRLPRLGRAVRRGVPR